MDTELIELVDEYFAALYAGEPGKLPLAQVVRFTENGQELSLGAGLWATVTGVSGQRALAVADPETGQAAGWGLVSEAGEEHLLAVRLKAHPAGGISEIETMVVRPAAFGQAATGFPAVLGAPYPGLLDPVPAGPQRATRAELTAAADGYFSGVSLDDPDLVPVADDCVRIENGRKAVRNAFGEGFPEGSGFAGESQLSITEQIRRGFFRYIENVRDRRFILDTERGLAVGLCLFDQPGLVRGATWRSPFPTPNSMMVFGAFKVAGGLIRHINVIGTIVPYGMRTGW